MKKFLVAGLYRTGHHAISVWMLHQFPGVRGFSINTVSPWMFALEENNNLHILANSPFKENEHKDKKKFAELIEKVKPETVILTHEQERLGITVFEAAKREWFWPPHMVVVIREFRNWVASCIRMTERDNKPVESEINEKTISLYENHITSFLENGDSESVTFILYDKWATDPEYRKQTCDKLGLTFTDAAKEQLSIFGGGSSFDNMNFLKEASKMDVTNRYKTMEDNLFYKAIIHKHKAISLMSKEAFS